MYGDVLPFDLPDWSDLTVAPINTTEAADFISRHHYSGGGGTQATCIGLYRGVRLVGVAAFAAPVSGDAAASVFGVEHQHRVMDLQRFVLVDEAPKNTESWFLVRALRSYKCRRPHTWAVTSYADAGQGHLGVIYQATNAIYSGVSHGSTAQYIDSTGRLRSDRMDGRTLTRSEAARLGWSYIKPAGKHRYVFLLPDGRAHGRHLRRINRWPNLPYPKRLKEGQVA